LRAGVAAAARSGAPTLASVLRSLPVNFSQTSGRRFVVPTSLGIGHRILGGYVYLALATGP
jgi:hypothetical protein